MQKISERLVIVAEFNMKDFACSLTEEQRKGPLPQGLKYCFLA